jgi:site-specific recombinase XerD
MAMQEVDISQRLIRRFFSRLSKESAPAIPQQEVKPQKRKGRKLPKVLKPGDAEIFLGALNTKTFMGLRDRCILDVMYSCGLRVSEVCNLTVDDVDLEEGYFYVQQAKGNKDRTVPMDADLIGWLQKWVERRPQQAQYFFCTAKGGKLSTRQIRRKCEIVSEKSGVYIRDGENKKPVHPHTLRHCCFTELLEAGFSLPEIQELAGHTSINTTAIYLHVRPEALRRKMRDRKRRAQ